MTLVLKDADSMYDTADRAKADVCHLTSAHRATDTRIFTAEARSLAAAGYQVTIIGRHDRDQVLHGINIVKAPHRRCKSRRFSAGLLHILRLAIGTNAHLYHFHDPELIIIGLALKALGKKVIYDAHEDYEQKLLSSDRVPFGQRTPVAALWSRLEKLASRAFDCVLTADAHTAHRFAAHKTRVIANFPPLRFARGVPRQAREDQFRIIYVGTIAESRGIRQVIDALDLVQTPSVRFHVLGATQDPAFLELFSTRSKVIYHGRIPWDQLPSHLAAAHVGVALYQPVPAYLYAPGENIVKLFEYMSLGLPVLLPSFPQLERFVSHGGFGMTVDPTDPARIAAAIDYLHRNPSVREEMGRRGRQAVLERYNWEHEERKLLAVYQEVLRAR
jgi:glycosyltransferase involved in cell wall biosynthesis